MLNPNEFESVPEFDLQDKPKVEPHPNLIGKFEPESKLIVAQHELEPEPCDLGS